MIRGEVRAQGPAFKINKMKNENQIAVEVKLKKEIRISFGFKRG